MNHNVRMGPESQLYSRSVSPLTSTSCDVVKKGSMYVKRLPTKKTVKLSIKTWQKKYLMLRDDWREPGTTSLDIYDRECEAPGSVGRTIGFLFFASHPYTVDLRTVISVEPYLESRSFVHALILVRANNFPVILGAESDHEVNSWMAAITSLAEKACRLLPRLQKYPTYNPDRSHDARKPVKGTLSAMSALNRSTPQLSSKVLSPGPPLLSIKRQMSSTILDNISVDLQDGEALPSSSPRTTIASSDFSEYHAMKKISNSPISSFGSNRESVSKWRPFSNSNRKDSGFSESFDDSMDQNQPTYSPAQDTVVEEDQTHSSSPPPLPPRQFSNPLSPIRTPSLEPLFGCTPPPRPPPRPVHTLQHF